jgi:hypothetical protein
MLLLLPALLHADDPAPLNLRRLPRDWRFSISRSLGQFGDSSDFLTHGSVTSRVIDSNNSVRLDVKCAAPIGNRVVHLTLRGDAADVFDASLSIIARLKFGAVNTSTAFLRGISADGRFDFAGLVREDATSVLTATATESDEVFVIRATPPAQVGAGEIIARLLPAIAVVFFAGFGRTYRKRFWRQYRTMNTRSLQNRMRETQQKKGKASQGPE